MLEDFFTLTEMKEGISTVARITELISEMRKLENSVDINTFDVIRQCSTAANTLTSTKNEECLQHFVQLNGVSILNHWLQDAQNCGGDVSNPAAEDLIVAILTALDCLPISNEQSVSCGVMPTVGHLLAHRIAVINQKARALCHKWGGVPKHGTNGEHFHTEESSHTDQLKSPDAGHKTETKRKCVVDEGEPDEESKPEVTTHSDAPLSDPSLTNDNADATEQPAGLTSPNPSNGNATLGDVNNLVRSPTSAGHVGLEDGQSTPNEISSNDAELPINGILRSNSTNAKSGTGQDAPVESTPVAMSVDHNKPGKLFPGSKMGLEDSIISVSSSIKESQPFAAGRSHLEKDTTETLNHLAVVTRDLQDLSEESTSKEDEPTSSSSTDDMDMSGDYILQRCMSSFGGSSKAADTKSTALEGEKSTRMADFDDTDALEVARLVAIEVEREVIDYREPFCSSPDTNSRNADSPDLEGPRQPVAIASELNDNKSSSTEAKSGSSSSHKEDGSGITDGSGPLSRKHTHSVDLGNLDLNENQCAEETDFNPKSILSNSVNLSMPIAVAASRGSSVFPARLHFEGGLGWKGSAATSAFRPAPPRRTPDAEKSLSASSHKTSNILFDLNVADNGSATSGEPLSTAILPASSELPSEVASKAVDVSGGLKLDLNFSCGDEEDAITASNVPSLWNHQQFNGNWSQPSFSSSKQPAARNFDLNDNMSIADVSVRGMDGSSVKTPSRPRDMSDHSAVTIMGKRIVVGQRDDGQQYQHNFLGPSAESRVFARPTQSFAHTPDYSVLSYPSQPAMPFTPAFFAPGGSPYLVDAKGAPVIPPLSGLSLGISHPSFNTRATQPSSNELSYFHPSVDFSYGVSSEGARREAGSYWPMSYQGQTMFVDERMRNVSQDGTSGLVLKRKEPESGWDLYPRR